MPINNIKKRNWDIVAFDRVLIENAIAKACESIGHTDHSFIPTITDFIIQDLDQVFGEIFINRVPTVEDIQDIVERNLVKFNKFDVAKEYILYRSKQSEAREKQKEKLEKKLEKHTLKVTKSNGSKEAFDVEKIKKLFNRTIKGYEDVVSFDEVEAVLKDYIIEGIETKDIIKVLIKITIDLISVENTAWQMVAGRLKVLDLYKQASRNRDVEIEKLYTPESYLDLMKEYVDADFYYKKFLEVYSEDEVLKAGAYIDGDRDYDYNLTQVTMFNKRYLLNPNKIVKELPQHMYMSVALFLAIPEKPETRLDFAMKLYDSISTQKISLPTPTLLNSRTNFHQLSSCFKINIDDSLREIYHAIENMAQISKYGGGIGVYLGNIRSRGSMIRHTKGASGGVNPWIKVINDTAVAVNQLGARAGAISVTLDIWHRDIYDFLDLQTETGDIRAKAFDVFPAVSIPDLFMKRMQANEDWTLFDPHEIRKITGKTLQDNFNEDFEKFYIELENDDRIELKKSVPAKDLFKKFMKATVETGMPYVFYRDTVNKLNPNKHAGNIYSTQLCTEICQNTSPAKFVEETLEDGKIVIKYDPGDFVVCNLASINVARVHDQKEIDAIFPIAMRVLDNVITLNFYPIKEAERTAKRYRSVGLGFLGLAEHLAVNKLAYDSEEARTYVDGLFEKFAYATLKSSNELAKERGTYEVYEGSEWQKGVLIGKDAAWFEKNSDMADKWKVLIENIKQDGMRFAYHLAPAPNTSTALVTGTTAALLPIYKKYFVENNMVAPSVMVAPQLNQENFWFYKEYTSMDMNDVIDMISTVYKWIDQSISFEWMIDPSKVSPAELYGYYLKSWEQGVKTVYYVRSMSGEVKEDCVSCSG